MRDSGIVLWLVILHDVLWIIMLECFSSAKLPETGSHLVSQYTGIPTGLHVISPTPLALM